MTKGNDRRGYITPQPAAAISALDFAAGQPCIDREAWSQAVAVYEAAMAKLGALTEAERDDGEDTTDEWNAASSAVGRAVDALWMTRAPDAAAMGFKARLMVEHQHVQWNGDDTDSPAFILRLLAEGPGERFAAALYQDGLALAGDTGPLVTAQPDPFDAGEWLAEVEGATGARLSKSDQWNNVAFVSARDGADVEGATRQLRALSPDHENQVETIAADRDRNVNIAEPLEPLTPEQMAAGREALIDALANLSAKGPDRDAMRARIAEAATPWVLTVEERGTGPTIRAAGQ